MSDEEEKVNSIARLIDAQYLREISKTMEGGFSSLLDRVGGVSKQIEDLRFDLSTQAPPAEAQRDKLLQWIDATSTYEIFVNAKNNRQSGTCDWILQRKEFTDWLDSDRSSKVLWLHGKHGTGKTILSARIAVCLMKECPARFAYFFCHYGSEKKRNVVTLSGHGSTKLSSKMMRRVALHLQFIKRERAISQTVLNFGGFSGTLFRSRYRITSW